MNFEMFFSFLLNAVIREKEGGEGGSRLEELFLQLLIANIEGLFECPHHQQCDVLDYSLLLLHLTCISILPYQLIIHMETKVFTFCFMFYHQFFVIKISLLIVSPLNFIILVLLVFSFVWFFAFILSWDSSTLHGESQNRFNNTFIGGGWRSIRKTLRLIGRKRFFVSSCEEEFYNFLLFFVCVRIERFMR